MVRRTDLDEGMITENAIFVYHLIGCFGISLSFLSLQNYSRERGKY
jgi:hypothetical protein